MQGMSQVFALITTADATIRRKTNENLNYLAAIELRVLRITCFDLHFKVLNKISFTKSVLFSLRFQGLILRKI